MKALPIVDVVDPQWVATNGPKTALHLLVKNPMFTSRCPHCNVKLGDFLYAHECPHCHEVLTRNLANPAATHVKVATARSWPLRAFFGLVRLVES